MTDKEKELLYFHPKHYAVKTCTLDSDTITYRAFIGLDYCLYPVAPVQKLNLYVPEDYYDGKTINGFTIDSAPIFVYNTSSGYMQGDSVKPEKDFFTMRNGCFEALRHGYIVAAPGIRGRNSKDKDSFTGKVPAMIVDLKAAIRYLHFNKDRIPGSTNHIITCGTSAGGALSALAAASANHPDYDPYLEEIGAPKASDEVFAACCYCPIHNLEHADSAYEWMFQGETTVSELIYDFDFSHTPLLLKSMSYKEKTMSSHQLHISEQLRQQFIAYLNSLGLEDDSGNPLTLDSAGNGSFKEEIKKFVISSAQNELDTAKYKLSCSHLYSLLPQNTNIKEQDCFTIKDGKIIDMDWFLFIKSIRRNKFAPAFDDLSLSSCENDAFGTTNIPARHFTAFSYENSERESELAETHIVDMINPVHYIGNAQAAKHWWIRHSIHDCATSLAIPVILATLLKNRGYNVNFELPWGLPHCGDYDMDSFFTWADRLCIEENQPEIL